MLWILPGPDKLEEMKYIIVINVIEGMLNNLSRFLHMTNDYT